MSLNTPLPPEGNATGFRPRGEAVSSQRPRRMGPGPAPQRLPGSRPRPRPPLSAPYAARGHVDSQRPELPMALPTSCPPPCPAPSSGPRPRPGREEERGSKGRTLAQAAGARPPAGRPSRPALTCGARGLPELPAARHHSRKTLTAQTPPPSGKAAQALRDTRLPRRARGGRTFTARGQSSRAAAQHWGNPGAGCGGRQSATLGARDCGARPNSAVAQAGPGTKARAALTVAAREGLC
jgi:hypothetical protein